MIDSLLNQASITLYLYTLNWVYVLSNYVLRKKSCCHTLSYQQILLSIQLKTLSNSNMTN